MRTKLILTATLLLSTLTPLAIRAAESVNSLLLANFDFESADSASVWHAGNAKTPPAVLKLDSDSPHSGKSALKFQPGAAEGSSFVFTGINLPEGHGDKIRVRLYARGDGLDAGDAQINLLERSAEKVIGWCGGKQAIVSIDAGNDWREYTAEVPVAAEARVLTLMIRINHSTPQKAVWLDDISFEFADAATK